MTSRVLYTQPSCVPCRYLEKFINDNFLDVSIKEHGYHPLADKRPTLILDGTNAIVGVLAIEKYFKTHLVKT